MFDNIFDSPSDSCASKVALWAGVRLESNILTSLAVFWRNLTLTKGGHYYIVFIRYTVVV